jgi:hypothetical protein
MSDQELALVRVHIGTMHADLGINTNSDESDEVVKRKALKKADQEGMIPRGLYAIRATILTRDKL